MNQLLTNSVEKIFHPLLMPFYGALLPFLYTDLYFLDKVQAFQFFLLIAAASFILPLMVEIFFRLTNEAWFHLSDKQLELIPYVLSVPLTASLVVVFFRIGVPFWYVDLLFSSVIIILLTAIVGYFWNISRVLLGIGGVLGTIMSVCYYLKGVNPFVLFIFIFIVAGLVASWQLATAKHNKLQVYLGFLGGWFLGFMSIFVSFYLILLMK